MKKALQQNMSYKGFSALEIALVSKIVESGLVVFGVQEAQRLTGFSKTRLHNLFNSLSRKKRIIKILRNRYSLKETVFENRFAVATSAFIPSYVSFWSALSFYGFTEQQVRTVQIVVTKQFKKIEKEEISIQPITLKPKKFFGYIQENGFSIASKEKALIDSAQSIENAGGFAEFVKCLKNAWGEINKKTFTEYLLRLKNKSLNSRMGFLLEALGLPMKKSLLQKIYAERSKGFVKLNPAKNKSNKYNKKWNIIVNDSIDEKGIL